MRIDLAKVTRGIGGLAVAAVCGCATTMPNERIAEMSRRIEDAQKRTAAAEQRIEVLEDRIFLLTDQLESQKVAENRAPPPRLPVLTLTPAPPSSDDGTEVVYEGAATIAAQAPPLSLSAPRSHQKPETVAKKYRHDDLGVAEAPTLPSVLQSQTATPVALKPRDAAALYKTGYEALQKGQHDQAVADFREFIRRFPHHDYADNAQYWLGECFYDRQRFAEAAAEFRAVVANYPLGNKAPDGLLKLGYSLLAIGQNQQGRELLKQLEVSYPRSDAARLATERLANIGNAKPQEGQL